MLTIDVTSILQQDTPSLLPVINNVKKTIARKLGADTGGSNDYLEDSMRKVNKYVRNRQLFHQLSSHCFLKILIRFSITGTVS